MVLYYLRNISGNITLIYYLVYLIRSVTLSPLSTLLLVVGFQPVYSVLPF